LDRNIDNNNSWLEREVIFILLNYFLPRLEAEEIIEMLRLWSLRL